MSPTSPTAPNLAFPYPRPVRALLIRTGYAEEKPWTDSAGVRAVEVLGLDAAPAVAVNALVEFREGSARRKRWVAVSALARTPAAAADKMQAHFSALLSDAQRPAKMPVTTTPESSAEAISNAEANR